MSQVLHCSLGLKLPLYSVIVVHAFGTISLINLWKRDCSENLVSKWSTRITKVFNKLVIDRRGKNLKTGFRPFNNKTDYCFIKGQRPEFQST
jgi:hypothetical protein